MTAKGTKENKVKGFPNAGGKGPSPKGSINGTGIRKAGSKSKLNDVFNGGKLSILLQFVTNDK